MSVPHDAAVPSRRLACLEAVLILALANALFVAWLYTATFAVVVGLIVAEALLVALVLWRRDRGRLVGPLFFYDLLRLARRGRSTLLRCVYAGLLFVGLWCIYTIRFPHYDPFALSFEQGPTLPIDEMAKFAEKFAIVILMVQGAAVLVLTPAYLAGAITEEKERRTLELLFTTDLRSREIVLGKLFARLTHLAGVLLTGLPILSLAQLWGGVEMRVLLASFAVTGLSLLSVGSVSILVSVLSRSVLRAVVGTYVIVVASSTCCICTPVPHVSSPLFFLVSQDQRVRELDATATGPTRVPLMWTTLPATPAGLTAQMVVEYGVVHGFISVLCLGLAISQLRTIGLGQTPEPPLRVPPPEKEWVWEPRRQPSPLLAPVAAPYARPPVMGRPLLWMELYRRWYRVDYATWPIALPVVIGLLPLLLAMMVVTLSETPRSYSQIVHDYVNPTVRLLSISVSLLCCVGIAFRAAGSISRERDQRTLESLLTLPVERVEILHAKWLGSVLSLRYLVAGVAGVWALGGLTGALHPLAVPLLALACAVHVAFLTTVGLWLSLVCRSTLMSHLSMALVLLIVFVGCWLLLVYSDNRLGVAPGDEGTWLATFWQLGLNPLRTWWFLGFSWAEFGTALEHPDSAFFPALAATLAGLLVYATAAGLFWLLTCRQFRGDLFRH